ncbi:hypothetical protein [Ancylobacter amanitiformis]|uniref:Uncharacterized protein (UPF0335 family) n=1 Tax=Ancylobacter amanitiformis TaxID=217069 RepID=A0ABU0LQI1_9HYPH|nr:hypothetical protein [Ancylobacter amanitiformis]MDQ0510929.1 uncharacterized protein (UPF0335 family) [Ancylobacter amanitiformis]
MAKKAKPNTGSVDRELCAEFERRYASYQGDLDSLRSDYMNACKDVRGDMKDLFEEAKERGIVLKPFKARLKVLNLRKRIEKVRDELEAEDARLFDYYDDEGDKPAAKKVPGKRASAEQQADREAVDEFENETFQ